MSRGRSRLLEVWDVCPEYFPRAPPEGLDDAAKPWFGDLNSDGPTEFLFLDPQSAEPDRLLCFSRAGSRLWSFTPGRQVASGCETFSPTFRVMDFHAPYYPLQAALLSPKGDLLREYWHSGHVKRLAVDDMNQDGRDEIYLAGVSNGYKAPTLVVLDPLTMSGASREENPDYQLQGFPPPVEIARILFPISRASRGLSEYGVVRRVLPPGRPPQRTPLPAAPRGPQAFPLCPIRGSGSPVNRPGPQEERTSVPASTRCVRILWDDTCQIYPTIPPPPSP